MYRKPISVILPAYNAEKYIGESINSILNQSFSNFELLIIDDGSKDDTANIVEYMSKRDDRIQLVSRDNRGLSQTLNELMEMAEGKYVARMDDDDFSLPQRLEKQYEFMENNIRVDVLGTPIQIYGTRKIAMNSYFSSDAVRPIRHMFRNAGVAHPTAFYRKSFFENNSLCYDINNLGSEDYQLWCDVFLNGGMISSLKTPFLLYRIVPGSMSVKYKKSGIVGKNNAKIKLLDQFGEFSDDELRVFCGFTDGSLCFNPDVLFSIFTRIISENRKLNIFNRDMLKKELAYEWERVAISRLIRHGNKEMMDTKYIKVLCKSCNAYVFKNMIMNH